MDLSLDLSVEAAPETMTGAERQKAYRDRDPERWKGRRTAYRRENSKWETDASYLSHPFVAWDGEGITTPDGVHRYVMLAVKSRTDSDYIQNVHGLGTAEIFDFVMAFKEREEKGSINVIYGGGYDFNMFFRDLPKEVVDRLYHSDYARWQGYRLAWRPGKSFYIGKLNAFGKPIKGSGVTFYDVVSFFQCPFVKACDDYLGSNFYERDKIVANKALRSSFTEDDVPTVRDYNDAELYNLLALMEELRLRLNRCGLRPRRWDGPGAVASALLLRENVKDGMAETPAEVARASRYAYAGGRFEVIQFGNYDGKVYEYDVNSAYPAALRSVPDLRRGRWEYVKGDPGNVSFGIFHVRYSGSDPSIPGAFFRRDQNGTICYPMEAEGWYWTPEVAVGRDYCARGHGKMEITEAWVFRPDRDAEKPFAFIDALYLKRKALKKAKDGAHVGIKLALNSLYGKLAQQVGARIDKETGEWRKPPFHQLEWAGYTTSWCRARVLAAVMDNLSEVIAFETDAVFTTCKLDVDEGEELGAFEYTEFDNLLYVQSGMYFGLSEGKEVEKTRGVDRGELHREMVLDRMRLPRAEDRKATAKLTRFVGAGIALSQSWERWRTWEVMEKKLTLEPTGKRVHMCECMTVEYVEGRLVEHGITDGLHRTACPMLNYSHSCEFPIVWINPNPDMRELEELRNQEVIDFE